MAVLYVPVGMPGCGKSTVAASLPSHVVIVNPDSIREELTGDVTDQSKNSEVFRLAHDRAGEALTNGQNVFFDATNLTPKARASLIKIAALTDAMPVAVLFLTPPAECRRRNRERSRIVPEAVMDAMEARRKQVTREVLEVEGFYVLERSD